MTRINPLAVLIACTLLLAACSGGENPATAAAVETPTPTPVPTTPLPYVENFDDGTTCFNPDVPDFAALRVEFGELVMEVTESRKLFWSICNELVLDNFILEMDVFDDTRAPGFHFFGVQFRRDSFAGGSNQYYLIRFGLAEGLKPTACAGLASDDRWVADLTHSPAGDSCWLEVPGPMPAEQWNHVVITANGPELTIVVNNVPVAGVNDARITRGGLALFAGTHSRDYARFKIDNLQITSVGE